MTIKKMELIDRDQLVEALSQQDCITLEKVNDVVYSLPIVAVATPKFDVEIVIF